ncbi:hypothetical protein [Actinomadura geliboluensis]
MTTPPSIDILQLHNDADRDGITDPFSSGWTDADHSMIAMLASGQ